uniref:CUB domain-containing protein n=1 Tax=Ditylenchus dipsaci TaxID=166011 RepID=A0A915DAZ1_9BILA
MATGGYEAFYYTVNVYSLIQLGEANKMVRKQMYELIQAKHDSAGNNSSPAGLNCVVEVVKADFTDEDDVDNCTSRDHARSVAAPLDTSLGGQKTRAKSLDWVDWPCKISSTMKLTLPTGHMLLIDFYTDDNSANDGSGFRLNWKCEHYQTPLL